MAQVRPFPAIEWVDIFVLCQLGVVFQTFREGIIGESVTTCFDDTGVQTEYLYITISFFYTVAGIGLDIERILRKVLEGHGVVGGYALDGIRHGKSEIERTVLKQQELATAVGCAHDEVVERLIILHQIGLYELQAGLQFDAVVCEVFRISFEWVSEATQIIVVGLEQHVLKPETSTLVVEDVAERP